MGVLNASFWHFKNLVFCHLKFWLILNLFSNKYATFWRFIHQKCFMKFGTFKCQQFFSKFGLKKVKAP